MSSRAAILLVEDDASVRTTMSAALTLVGFRVHQSDSIDAALRVLGTEEVDAIVLDLHVPDSAGPNRSGLRLLKFVRASVGLLHLPVLIFTDVELTPSESQAAVAHGARVFRKPEGSTELIEYLTRILPQATT